MSGSSGVREGGESVGAQLQRRGWALVRLSEAGRAAAAAGLEAASSAAAPPPESAPAADAYYGVHRSGERVTWFVREKGDGTVEPAPNSVAAQHFRALREDCIGILTSVAADLSGAPNVVAALTGLVGRSMEFRPASQSNSYWSIMKYGGETAVLAEHVDQSLLTLAPFTQHGLEVLDLERFEFVDPQAGMKEGGPDAVVLVGETLEAATGGRLCATTHRVQCPASPRDGARTSCPFFLFAGPGATLRPALFDTANRTPKPEQDATAFVARCRAAKGSAVYGGAN
ncbi:hypothetical protein T484DRAFT_1905949 [Baffinella frigidus]|nr:hypothetical protein T484DRAFT_1905949 [Cryptophyta sp. CCMP2293]